MCKHVAIVVVVFLVSTLSHAQVFSLNAMGVINVSLQADTPELVTVQLIPADTIGSTFLISEVFGTNGIPPGTEVRLFDSHEGVYRTETFSLGWSPNTNRVMRGQAMWVSSPSNITLRLAGYVPGSDSATTDVSVATGLQLVGYPYPVSSQYTNTIFGPGQPGDILIPVNAAGIVASNAEAVAWYEGVGWMPNNGGFEVADGWWYRCSSNKTWNVSKPYSYP